MQYMWQSEASFFRDTYALLTMWSQPTILCKVFWVKLRNQAKLGNNEKLWCLFLSIFWAPVSKFYFCRGDWTLGYAPMQFWDLTSISLSPKILSLKLLGKSWDNSYLRFLILDTKVPFYFWQMERVLKLCKIPSY